MGGRLSVRVVSGPLAPYASGYGSWLAARGYSPWTISHRRRQLQVLSCWLESEGLAVGELGPECVERFLLARRAAGYSPWLSARSVVLPVGYYRLLVYARVTLANGHASSLTACAGCAGAPKSSSPSTLSIRPQGNNPVEPDSTKQMQGTPCFVYQGGLDFIGVNGTYVVNYNGYAACRGQQLPAHPSLTLCVQVAGRVNGKNVWFTVNGSCMSAESAASDTVVLSTARTAFIGHGYRIMASATVHYPTARGTITSSASTYSAAAGP